MVTAHILRFRRLAKEAIWILTGQISSIFGALVLIRALTEYLEPEEYGQLALGLTLAGFVNQVVMGGVTAGISRYYSIATESNDLYGYFLASRKLMGYATIAVALMALTLTVFMLSVGLSQWVGLAIATLIFALLTGYNGALSGLQNAARQRAIVALHIGLDSWLKILLAIGVMVWLGSSSTKVVLAYALSAVIVICSQLFFLRQVPQLHNNNQQPYSSWLKKIWTYSWPFSVFGAFTWMQQISDRWALNTFTSEYEVGLYMVVFQLGYVPIGLVSGISMTFLGPIFYQRAGTATDLNRKKSVHEIAWYITYASLLITIVAFVLTFFLHEWIFQLLVSTKYHVASSLLPWMVLAGGIFSAGQILALKLMSEMKSAAMTTAKIVTAMVGIALNIYGASQFGLQGLTAALVAFSSLYFIWMAWLSQRARI